MTFWDWAHAHWLALLIALFIVSCVIVDVTSRFKVELRWRVRAQRAGVRELVQVAGALLYFSDTMQAIERGDFERAKLCHIMWAVDDD